MAKNKNITKLHCPECGMEHHINKHTQINCLCLAKLVVIKNGKEKQLVKTEDSVTVKKGIQVKCRDCISYFPKDVLGDCLDIDNMKRNVDGNCARICKKFKEK
ncbi:ribosomal protein S27E [Sedimentibacter acidaminivorans]|uniref:Ribosomal protein S27E n=1 Tax=Sedimentibacter acidaminivorans TaxID=913099 RepID=A0ABS4GAA9_9FIRM|nr:hypothetical protein [Sedimentibacter acidaminivorans]MBP1924622.1 ribosomal protein S27E [Sedimentibacter acidaminivorans]